ncbi:Metabotropic glutamate receptor [Paragonimus heterotremus]|uniref:Metabotropic glutamate receptor n=1 Tax=Paragonimus heterotremus TaxID=100268 RepID=A0A8J4TJ77_9TREM|nr:Metabotropic glutamate receptor [Paragonimus heterotremus]
MTFSSVGICITIWVITTWRVYSETPIVRATGRELAYLQLSGCLVCFAVPFILLATPSIFTCTMQRILIGLGFAMMYASLLTKTNRIARIFDAAKRTTRRPVYISPRSQLVIAGALITLQLAFSAIWFGFDTPATRIEPVRSDYLVIRCAMKDKSFLISLAYNVVLIIVCTAYAVKTRQIPENFNESKFIGFAMYTTCIIWLAFLPMYYATMNNHEIQITTLCISINLSASVILCCLFIPKLYIIYLHPEKNVRRLTMNNPSAKQKLREFTQHQQQQPQQQLNQKSLRPQQNQLSMTPENSELSKINAQFQLRISNAATLTSSTGTEEQMERNMSLSNASVEVSKNSVNKMISFNGIESLSQTLPNVIENPLAKQHSKRESLEGDKMDLIGNPKLSMQTTKPNSEQKRLSNFPKECYAPTPLILDPISKRVLLTPTYCDETATSADEDDYIPPQLPLAYQYIGASSSSQILSNQYAAPFSTTNSVCSVETPRSSDFYLQSYGEDTQQAASVNSTSPSVASTSVFTELRQPTKSEHQIDYTKQTVTAL